MHEGNREEREVVAGGGGGGVFKIGTCVYILGC